MSRTAKLYKPVSILDLMVAIQHFPAGVVAYVHTHSPTLGKSARHARCMTTPLTAAVAENIGGQFWMPAVFPDTSEFNAMLPSDVANAECAACGKLID